MDLLPNETVLVQWALFLLACVLLQHFIFKPTLKILKARREKILGEKERAQTLTAQAQELLNQVEKRIEEAHRLGSNLKEEQILQGFKEQAAIQKQVRDENQKLLQEVHKQIKVESDQARQVLKKDAETVARQAAETILERNL